VEEFQDKTMALKVIENAIAFINRNSEKAKAQGLKLMLNKNLRFASRIQKEF
jgi:hypothetical protein